MASGPQSVAGKFSKRSRLSGGGLIGSSRSAPSPGFARSSSAAEGPSAPAPPLFRPEEAFDDAYSSDDGDFEVVHAGDPDPFAHARASSGAPPLAARISHLPPPPKKKPRAANGKVFEASVEPGEAAEPGPEGQEPPARGRGRGRGAKSAGRGAGRGRGRGGKAKTGREQMERLVEATVEFPEHFQKLERTFKVRPARPCQASSRKD